MKAAGTVKQGRRPMFQAFIPNEIAIGKVDGELVDQNGIYITAPETKAEIVRRYNAHSEALAQLYRYSESGGEWQRVHDAICILERGSKL